MQLNLIPLHDRVLVRRIAQPQKGVIIRPDTAEAKTEQLGSMLCQKDTNSVGEVVAVGPGKWIATDDGWFRRPVSVQVGQIVHIGQYFDFQDDDLILVQEADIRVVEKC